MLMYKCKDTKSVHLLFFFNHITVRLSYMTIQWYDLFKQSSARVRYNKRTHIYRLLHTNKMHK